MKTVRIDAENLMAGDKLVVREGSVRKVYPVNEVSVVYRGKRRIVRVDYVYKERGGFKHASAKPKDRMTVRDD